MKFLSVFMKSYHPLLLISAVIILMTDVPTVTSSKPQPKDENNKNQSLDPQLPPKLFPKDGVNDSVPHLQGEVPPLHFPYESSHPVWTTMTSSKSNLMKKNKDTERDEKEATKTDKAAVDNKTSKVASEVPDLLKAFMNRTVYEDGTEDPLNNDTETVQGPNVVSGNKTHEEDITKSSIEKKSKVAPNETSEETKMNEKTQSKNTTNDDHTEETSNSTLIANETDTSTDEKQNSTQSPTIHGEGTESSGNVTTDESTPHNENDTEILEIKTVENETSTLEYNTSIPVVEKTTVTPITKNDSVDAKDQTTADNKTIDDNGTTLSVSIETSTSMNINETTTTTVLPSLKAESTTSVNMSENTIDYKADTPIAMHHSDHSHATSGKSAAFLQPTESAAILAGVFVGIALLGYVGLLVWRRILEKRYGNREMLVNEDDFYDTNDLRNFEL